MRVSCSVVIADTVRNLRCEASGSEATGTKVQLQLEMFGRFYVLQLACAVPSSRQPDGTASDTLTSTYLTTNAVSRLFVLSAPFGTGVVSKKSGPSARTSQYEYHAYSKLSKGSKVGHLMQRASYICICLILYIYIYTYIRLFVSLYLFMYSEMHKYIHRYMIYV